MTADAIIRLVFKGQNDAQNAINQVNRQVSSVGETVKKASGMMRSAGTVMSAAVTAPALLIGNKLVNAASDLNETVSKTQAIFKTNSAEMIAWANTTTRTMGLSKRAALDYAASFAGALKNVGGLSEDEAARASRSLTGLASDLSSFFNVGQEDVAGALRSALTGEFEPMKRFNVVINESILKQKALAMGLIKGKEEMSAAAKQAATLALIMEQTADAQGDFARTADGAANKERTVAAEVENLSAQIGQNLLPYKLKLLEVVSQLIGWFGSLSPEMQKAAVIIGAVAAAAGPVLVVLGSLVPIITGLGSVVGFVFSGAFLPVVGILAAVAAAGYLVYQNWETIKAAAVALVATVRASFQTWMADNEGVIAALVAAWNKLTNATSALWQSIQSALQPVIAALGEYLEQLLQPFGGVEGAMHKLGTIATQLATLYLNYLSAQLEALGVVLPILGQKLADVIRWITQKIAAVQNLAREIRDGLVTAIEWVQEKMSQLILIIARVVLKFLELKKNVTDTFNALRNMDWSDIGADIASGIGNGISSAAAGVKAKAVNMLQGVKTAAKAAIQSRSPSKLFAREVGEPIAEGVAVGILAKAKNVSDAILGLLVTPRPQFGAIPGQDLTGGIAPNPAAQMDQVMQQSSVMQQTMQGISTSIEGLITGTMTWGQALANVGMTIYQSIVKSIADATAAWITQHVIVAGLMKAQSALGLTLKAKDTATTVSSETTKLAAAAPAAMMTSISSYGIAAAVGIAAVIAAMAMANSFYTGGYTGDGDRRGFAGVVEHEEFVVNAASTSMNRRYLEYANRGGNLGNLFQSAAGSGYAAGAGTVPMMDASGAGKNQTVILVDSRAAADRAAAGVDGPVTIQMVRDEIGRFRG